MSTQKPKIDRTKYIIDGKKNETITKRLGDVNGFNFKIRNCTDCTIQILDWSKGVSTIISHF